MNLKMDYKFNVYNIDYEDYILIDDIKTSIGILIDELYKYDNDVANVIEEVLRTLGDYQKININNKIYDAINYKSFKHIINNKLKLNSQDLPKDKMEFNKATQIYKLINNIEIRKLNNNTDYEIKKLEKRIRDKDIAIFIIMSLMIAHILYKDVVSKYLQ